MATSDFLTDQAFGFGSDVKVHGEGFLFPSSLKYIRSSVTLFGPGPTSPYRVATLLERAFAVFAWNLQ